MFNVQQITARLATMSDAQLQQYARMHKDDPYIMPLAAAEAKERQQIRQAAMGQQAAQQATQPTVADKSIASMQLPEDQGIGVLPAQNIEGMADGGIAGYKEGGKPVNYDRYMQDPRVQRFLDYINVYEGAPAPNQMVGYRQFDDLSKHPNRAVRFNKRGDKSTAAGSYQLLHRTWQDQARKQGLTDFSLENQKRAAIGVLKETGALRAILQNDFGTAKAKAAKAWASLPGSTIGEATGQRARFKPQAERMLAEFSPPTTVAETKKPAPERGIRALKRQETVGLSPDVARQITEALPISTAQAADVVPRGEFKPATSPGAPAARGVTPLPTLPKEPTAAPAPAPAATAAPTPDLRFKDVPGHPDAIEYERQLRAGRGPERSYLAQRGRELLGAPEAGLSALTGAISPLTGTLYAAGRTLAGTPTTAEEGFGATTFAPRSEYGKESLAEMHRAFEDFKIPPYIPGVGTTSARPKSGKAVTAAELADAEAARAAQAVETAKAPRLEGPKSAAAGRTSDLQQRFAEAQERSAKALETADLLATSVVDGKLMTGKQKAAALRASMPKTEGFTPDPAAQQVGIEAVLARKRAQQAKDVMRAKEDAAKAARKAEETAVIAERERALDRGDKTLADVRRQTEARSNVFAPGVIGSEVGVRAPESVPAVPEVEYPDISENMYSNEPPKPKEEITPDKLEAAKDVAEQVAPKTGGLTNEDYLTMGLNMLMAQPGQPGGELSQLASNVGRSGLATLQARKDREKLAREEAYRDITGGYYKKLTQMYGRPELAERQIEEVMKANPGMSYLEAVEALSKAQFAPRAESALDVAAARNPFTALFGQGYMEPSGSLSPQGQAIFNQFYPKQ